MANNLVYFDTTSNVVQQFSASDVAKISDYILEFMAANGTFTGSITVGTSNPIGTFSDTTLGGYPYPEANSDNVTVYSTTYTLSQVNTATLTAASDPPMYVGLDVTDPNTVILQENKTTLDNLADEIIARMIADYGVNSYYLGTSAPSDGGVWTNLGSLVDTVDPSNTNTTYYLWKKLNSGSYTSDYKRPLKLSSGNLIQFTDIEIQQIVKKVEERIVATGKGLYSISSSAPGTGTWTAVGSSVDVRRTTQEVNFDGSVFQSSFDGPVFQSSFEGSTFQSDFIGSYLGTNPNYPFIGTAGFVSYYLGPSPDTQWFTNTSTPFANVNATPFINPDGTSFTNTAFFINVNETSFTNLDGTPFINVNAFPFINPTAIPFTNPNGTPFINVNAISYVGPTGTYSGPGPSYLGTTVYAGPGTYLGPGPTYLGPAFYLGPGVSYTGTVSYLGPTTYLGPGPTYLGSASYLGTGDNGANFQSPIFYGTVIFYGPLANAQYFSDPFPYTADYTATYTADYTATYTSDYIETYTGTRVSSSTTTIGTVYLWKRVA